MSAIFSGSFDPITNGHLDKIRRFRALWVDERLIMAVADDYCAQKKTLFSFDERISQIKEIVSDIDNIEVDRFSGLISEYAKKKHAMFIIRGVRNTVDFNYEMEMALHNRRLGDIETVFIPTDEKYFIVSSSAVRLIATLGGDADWMIPRRVRNDLREKLATI
ncbi:MAG: pantetheine-phosphate adenylyltransferase [Clostridiales bacterium]|jgi:pantetheine-phosphate adenylyltransferase|nr:pantetheine-phosphate adenylyltransferase [Clostridiales bacterium]